MRRIRSIALPIAGLLLAALCSGVRAEIRVQGEANDVRVEARDATVGDILAALAERFALRYRGTLDDHGVTATFEGPLRRVLVRVLAGYNYIITNRGEGLEVIVLSAGSPNAVPAPAFAPPTFPSKNTRRPE
jgi:hypothetical protein